MGSSPTPPGLIERIMRMVDERIARFARSGFLRNATISDGGLTIKGGFLRLVFAGFNLFYVGPVGSALSDGSYQQVVRIRRADGTLALHTYDAAPGADGTLNQALTWLDRGGSIVFSDDTDSGQGIGRPYLGFTAYPSRSSDFLVASGGSFTTLWRAKAPKQHPKLYVEVWANAPDAGAVAEVQVLVNGAVWDAPKQSSTGFVTSIAFGPLPVTGAHMATLSVEVQGRLASGTGNVQVGVARIEGRQT